MILRISTGVRRQFETSSDDARRHFSDFRNKHIEAAKPHRLGTTICGTRSPACQPPNAFLIVYQQSKLALLSQGQRLGGSPSCSRLFFIRTELFNAQRSGLCAGIIMPWLSGFELLWLSETLYGGAPTKLTFSNTSIFSDRMPAESWKNKPSPKWGSSSRRPPSRASWRRCFSAKVIHCGCSMQVPALVP